MSKRASIASLIAARRAVAGQNAELADWSRNRWLAWVQEQAGREADNHSRAILAVVDLSSLDDLMLHIGLMQLLGQPGIRCWVVLRLPSEEMARLARAQARREGWEGFVSIVAEDEAGRLADLLPWDMEVAVFRFPAHLPMDVLARLASGEPLELSLPSAFLGRASDYLHWRQGEGEGDGEGKDETDECWIAGIARLSPTDLQTIGPGPVEQGRHVRASAAWPGKVEPLLGRLELEGLPPSSEILVTCDSRPALGAIVMRRLAALCAEQPLNVRMPVDFMTVGATPIGIEVRNNGGGSARTEVPFHVPPSRLKPWMLSAFLNRGGAGNGVIRAFAHGTGCRIAFAEDEPEGLSDVPVVWGVLRGSGRILDEAKARSLYFFYIDHAYFNRGHGKTYRITRNGFEAGAIRDCPGARFRALGEEVLPWRRGGREIIVCPPTDFFMEAHGCTDWTETTLASIRSATDRPIILREKPKPGEDAVPLRKALETAHALVTHSSNVAIEAACLGTPVFVSPTSAAAPIGHTDFAAIETPAYPDRQPWLAHLAYNQFSFEEISSGEAWRLLLELEERPLV